MKPSTRILSAAAVCSVLCVFLSIVAIVTVQTAYSRFGPHNFLELSQDPFYAASGWAFLLYDLFHIFVIAVFSLILARAFSWEALMGGAASIVSSLADFASLSVNIFFLTAALRALAQGRAVGFPNPGAGYEVICSTLDFAQASFGLVGTLFLATAAIKASGIARVAGWFLIAGLPIGLFQIAEVGQHSSWTVIVDEWVTPIDEIALHIAIGIVLFAIIRHRIRSQIRQSTQKPITRLPSLQSSWLSKLFSPQPKETAPQLCTPETISSRSRIRTYSPIVMAVRLAKGVLRSPAGSPSEFTTRTASSKHSPCVK